MKFFFHLNWSIKILLFFLFLSFIFVGYFAWVFFSLPKLFNVSDYQPPLLTEVYDREGEKIGEFFKERRLLVDYEDFPDFLIHAIVSAEDGSFFKHKGLNYRAIIRALIANFKAGKKVQGGSTITQQLARTLLLSQEKTYTRKFKEAVLAVRMERSLTKQDILYIYLNQIYLGHGAYGIEMACRTYFRKSVKDITLPEAALLAGLPKAPSRFSPVFNPARAKSRQIYVLNRMREENYITEEDMLSYLNQEIKIFVRKKFNEESPYYLETVRLSVLRHLEEKNVLEGALKIWTAMDLQKQKQAKQALREGLENWDKRKGFRGKLKSVSDLKEQEKLLEETSEKLRSEIRSHLILPGFVLSFNPETEEISPDFFVEFKKRFAEIEEGNQSAEFWFSKYERLKGKIFSARVSQVSKNFIKVIVPWGEETLFLKDFKWAVPVEKKERQNSLNSAKELFKPQDVILVRVKNLKEEDLTEEEQIPLELYQEPLAEAALASFDLETSEIIALVGGYDYFRSQFNRVYQSRRQSGSVFKPFIYGAALERGFRPNTLINDSPVTFTPNEAEEKEKENVDLSYQEKWRPSNISGRFLGEILFRKALVRSLNVATVRIIEKMSLDWVHFYVRRMGIFSPLNPDFTMALGSSSITLYETLKAFSVFFHQGKRIQPILVHKVENSKGDTLISNLSLDDFFIDEIESAEAFVLKTKDRWLKPDIPEFQQTRFQKRWLPLFQEEKSDQLIPANSSYVVVNLMEGIVKDAGGTASRARVLNRPVGGKTGTTNSYNDAWFLGASPFISTAVWVGFDQEKSLGQGETGSRVALPIWIDYMDKSHKIEGKELIPIEFPVPDGVVFSNIDAETGQLVSSQSQEVFSQAFIEGTEPSLQSQENRLEDDEAQFIREEL